MLSKLRKFIYPIDIVLDQIPLNSKILDLGCGNGHLYNEIGEKNFISYNGIDPEIKSLIVNKKVKLIKKKVEDVLDEINDFDCVLMIDVMHHIDKKNQKKIFYAITKKLKSKSIFIYKDISNDNFFFSFMNFMHDLVYNFQFINYLSINDILKILKNDGDLSYSIFKKRVFWYDHQFVIVKRK